MNTIYSDTTYSITQEGNLNPQPRRTPMNDNTLHLLEMSDHTLHLLEVARETTSHLLIIGNDQEGRPVMLDEESGEVMRARSGDEFVGDDAEQYIATRDGWVLDTPEARKAIHTYGERL